MPARLVQVTLKNLTDYHMSWSKDGLDHGAWQDPWFPSQYNDLAPGAEGTWRSESDGILTGTKAWADFKIEIPNIHTEFLHLWWDRPYLGSFRCGIELDHHEDPNRDPQFHTYAVPVSASNMATHENFITKFAGFALLSGTPLVGNPLPLLVFEQSPDHIAWVVELRNTPRHIALPLGTPGRDSVIYALTAITPARPAIGLGPGMGAHPASGGDLLWYRHEGHDDGAFRWTDGNARKVGKGWDIKHIFSGGDGVIYATNAENDLLWYKHDGRDDGTFRWTDGNARKVGNGWDVKHIFSGGDGIIYAINAANDLLWYRHEGRHDGSFRWTDGNARKVGNGWAFKHVFSAGDGVIYAINAANDLLWYRHEGRDDGSFRWTDGKARKVGNGWDFKHIFCG